MLRSGVGAGIQEVQEREIAIDDRVDCTLANCHCELTASHCQTATVVEP